MKITKLRDGVYVCSFRAFMTTGATRTEAITRMVRTVRMQIKTRPNKIRFSKQLKR